MHTPNSAPTSPSRKRALSETTMTIPWPPERPAKRPFKHGPSPPPRITIDHRSFPHIIEAILDYADTHALLAIRGTSSAYRDDVDARLFRHVVVGSDFRTADQGLYITVPGPRGPAKPLLRWRAGENPPIQIAQARTLSLTNIEAWESNLFSSRSTDLVSSLTAHAPQLNLVRLSNSQLNLRFSKFLANAPAARTLVCIGAIARDDPCLPSGCSADIWVEVPALPIGMHRFVLTIPYKPCFAYRQNLVGLFGAQIPGLREAVIILANANVPHYKQAPGRRRSPRLTPAGTYASRRPNFSFLETIISEVRRAERGVKWTLVGVGAFLDEMDCTPTPTIAELEAYIDTRLEEGWRKRLSILEPAQYVRRVGLRQFELETRHPEDDGVRGRCSQLSW
ncbi:hypothetical protein CC85DRAFT_201251 [Cutaneotrichosporon oleaginosum]|uniref:Uncharacterized protein n=1 Tax=Cutaneotrichosporon oleaginosum TaxID=879819 RepID=A0A0J0XUB5_9TREE|nr:uncharacterized protein CC85DRAFT_201251 [Cutaneotrichosporon oleaginosum]KLT44660.1 hypothetical protein CC85DRAFT_201251 [Cutaneotrichosporon oleaginosum]TXT07647.1 hypothetical protein COLE_04571 [Cutaneotrichosporon oleaginosum]